VAKKGQGNGGVGARVSGLGLLPGHSGNTTFRLLGIYVPGPAQSGEDGWPAGKSAEELLTRRNVRQQTLERYRGP
jgi:hypothetical protein